MKRKGTAALLAFFFGIFGMHRFYLGQRPLGVFYFAFTVLTFALSISLELPFIAIAGIVAFMDAVLFVAMPKVEFDKKYNANQKSNKPVYQSNYQDQKYIASERSNIGRQKKDFQFLKRKGIEAYRLGYLEDAISYFNEALDLKPDDPAIHFNLACCHSKLEEPIDGFFHLEKAVEYGFDDLEKIQTHKALSFLRSTEDFELFISNGYQAKPLDLPSLEQEDDLLDQLNKSQSQQMLEKLKQLSELRDKGILTEEEFAEQKRRLLNE